MKITKRRLWPVLFIASSVVVAGDTLPQHEVVEKTPLSQGLRIQIDSSDPNLSKEQCISLIEAYRDLASGGQVSVHKPSTLKALKGAVTPFCVENFDEEGITFNMDFHPKN